MKRTKQLVLIVASVVVLTVSLYDNTRLVLATTDQTHGLLVLGTLQVLATIGLVGGLTWLMISFVRTPSAR